MNDVMMRMPPPFKLRDSGLTCTSFWFTFATVYGVMSVGGWLIPTMISVASSIMIQLLIALLWNSWRIASWVDESAGWEHGKNPEAATCIACDQSVGPVLNLVYWNSFFTSVFSIIQKILPQYTCQLHITCRIYVPSGESNVENREGGDCWPFKIRKDRTYQRLT